jgi:hypothetical protein
MCGKKVLDTIGLPRQHVLSSHFLKESSVEIDVHTVKALINHLFDILDLLVVRGCLFALLVFGAYALIREHRKKTPP